MISVIVPAYNTERWIREAIESVQAQTYTEWELVLVDDGSVDGTGSVMDEYVGRDSRIRVVHQSNCGVSEARNNGVLASRGEWVTFLDADDVICRHFLAEMLEAVKGGEVDIVSSTIERFTEEYKCRNIDMRSDKYSLSPPRAIRSMWLQNGEIDASPCGKIFRRDLLEKEKFRPGIRYEDLDIMYRLFAASREIVILKTSMYGYRQHSESFIHNYSKSRLDSLVVTARMEQWATRHDGKMLIENYSGIPKRGLLSAAWDRRMSANFNVFIEVELARKRGEISDEEADAIKSECYEQIRRLRSNSLLGRGIRIKNRIGALMSYLGPKMLSKLAVYSS